MATLNPSATTDGTWLSRWEPENTSFWSAGASRLAWRTLTITTLNLTLAFIVMLDAGSLRRQIGKHAQTLNRLAPRDKALTPLRERMGHTCIEIGAGIAVGIAVAAAIHAPR